MATKKYASEAALTELVTKIKGLLNGKVDKVDGYSLTKNDLTDALKANYDAAYTHSQAAHAPADAEKNVIVGLTLNGTAVSINAETRIAALTVSTDLADYSNASTKFQNDTQVATAISTALTDYSTTTEMNGAIAEAISKANHLKYTVVEALPTENIDTNTIYLVKKTTAEGQNAFTEYMYVNNAWEKLGDTMIDMSQYYTKTEIDTELAKYQLAAELVEITAADVDKLFE